MVKIQIITGSTRPNRLNIQVAQWVYKIARQHAGIEAELVDIADFNLPLLDEPLPARVGQYTNEHTQRWAHKIAEADGYIFVTPEYNHSVPAALKNAVDYLYHEWDNKAIGFVSYGAHGGTRAVEAWRLIAAELGMADVRAALHLSIYTDFKNFATFEPTAVHESSLSDVCNGVSSWAEALKSLRIDQ